MSRAAFQAAILFSLFPGLKAWALRGRAFSPKGGFRLHIVFWFEFIFVEKRPLGLPGCQFRPVLQC
jgi:hypothetical protein